MEVLLAMEYDNKKNADLAMQCALLHDTIEDTAVTADHIAAVFGQKVADGVSALTKNPHLTKAERLTDSLDRILRQPLEIWMVKLADRITNLQEPPLHWDGTKRQRYLEEAILIRDTLGTSSAWLNNRIAKKIIDYRQYFPEK